MLSINKMLYLYRIWIKYNKNTIVVIPWEDDYMLLCFHEPFFVLKKDFIIIKMNIL